MFVISAMQGRDILILAHAFVTALLIVEFSNRILLAFKGTTSTRNLKTYLKVMLVSLLSKFPTCELAGEKVRTEKIWRNAQIHAGFIKAYSSVSQQVLSEVKTMLKEQGSPIFSPDTVLAVHSQHYAA